MKSVKITYIALLSALAIIFGYIESLFPLPIPIPGVKLGISNIVILFSVMRLNKSDAFFIMLIKVFVCSLLFSGMNTLLYSLCGGVLSLAIMILLYYFGFNIITISIFGGVFHNIGQIAAASVMLKSFNAFYYLPVLIFSGIAVGFIIGITAKAVMSRLK